VEGAKRHEAQLLEALDEPEKAALRKLLKKLAPTRSGAVA
jgi:hypothetical protein